MSANQQIYDKAVSRAAYLRSHESNVLNRINTIWDDHEERVQNAIKAKIRDLKEEYAKTKQYLFNSSSRSLTELASDQISYTFQHFEAAASKIWKAERPPRVTEALVLKQPLFGNKVLEESWGSITSSERRKVEAVIRKGIANGDNVEQIALAVRKGNYNRISRSQSKALTITAITSVVAQSDMAVYKANEKALVGWQYIAVLDRRTTQLCASLDGKIFPIDDYASLPPRHVHCRSKTAPVLKSWEDMIKMDGVANIRKRNLAELTKKQRQYYDGQTPLRESYDQWLRRQPKDIQLKHLGDYKKFELFSSGQLTLDKFTTPEGMPRSLSDIRADSVRFALAKERLDAMRIPVSTVDDFLANPSLVDTMVDYYDLQAKDLDGLLSLTNYRGKLLGNKRMTKNRVLTTPPREDQLIFNPVTGKLMDTRIYMPNRGVFERAKQLVNENEFMKDADKQFIHDVVDKLGERMGVNERAVVYDNLRNMFSRYRENGQVWGNFKAAAQGQIKYDVMNISGYMETAARAESDAFKKLQIAGFQDALLGNVDIKKIHDSLIPNIMAKNLWEDRTEVWMAKKMHGIIDFKIPERLAMRMDNKLIRKFYQRTVHRLALAQGPDYDQLAMAIGRDLYNTANINGNRYKWHTLGDEFLNSRGVSKFIEIDEIMLQKRRMKSRNFGAYFGPYYDTVSKVVRVVDKDILKYQKLGREIDLAMRLGVMDKSNRLYVRPGYKTFWFKRMGTWEDSRIPITSTGSFTDFPEKFVDKNLADALNWAASSKYKIDEDFYDFTMKLINFRDDKGKADYYAKLNNFLHYLSERDDVYGRFKAMEYYRSNDIAFSNHPFIDHRARIYERGFVSPQAGETFRPFLNTAQEKILGQAGFENFRDQIGAFIGGLSDELERGYNSLTFTGRQKIADLYWKDLTEIGNAMIRKKPNDIRFILEHPLVQQIDGEEVAKFFRFAIETAKMESHLSSGLKMDTYKTALALEQDASSSGAQIIAITTKNKQLAAMSNVITTNQKRRLYDEIAAATFTDPRFIEINARLGLKEKDLRKAAKAQNMVTFYGAGERTGILNVEGKLAKALEKQEGTMVVKAGDRDKVLNEISARAARYERFDPEMAEALKDLRTDVRDIFNKGLQPGDDIMEQLYFLDPATKALVEKMTGGYDMVVSPNDFKMIASIMSDHLANEVPILKDFTKFFGRLAEDYLLNAKPKQSAIDWKTVLKADWFGTDDGAGVRLSDNMSMILGLKPKERLSEKILKRFDMWHPDSTLHTMIYGAKADSHRITGKKWTIFELEGGKGYKVPQKLADLLRLIWLWPENLGKAKIFKVWPDAKIQLSIMQPSKMPKNWTSVPWVNFDGKTLEQNFTQVFEERILRKDANGNWYTNILQVPQKTEEGLWDVIKNVEGKINDIADTGKARTAYAVNGNHSNDATLVKNYHLWGKSTGTATSTIHDAFFANAADMLPGREALKHIYANAASKNSVRATLDEMLARGLPKELYKRYLAEAIEKGLIPVPGKSVIGGRVITKEDILRPEDILKALGSDFNNDTGWYGVG